MVASGQRKSQVVLGLSSHEYDLAIPSSSPSSKNAALSTALIHVIPPTTRSRVSVDLPWLAASLNILAAGIKLVKFKNVGRRSIRAVPSRKAVSMGPPDDFSPPAIDRKSDLGKIIMRAANPRESTLYARCRFQDSIASPRLCTSSF